MHLVAVADLRADPLARARAAVAGLGAATGARVETVVTDVSDPAQVAAAGRTAEQAFGRLHVLVNNSMAWLCTVSRSSRRRRRPGAG